MEGRTRLFDADRFHIERVKRAGPAGKEIVRDVIRHPGAVTILPMLDDGRVCLIRNYRVAVDQTLLELPAGTLESGEDPAETARRELAEETGYRAGQIELLTTFFMSPGILDEKMYLFLANSLQPGPAALQPDEDIRPVPVSWPEAVAMTRDGRIRDAKTLVGLLYYAQLRDG